MARKMPRPAGGIPDRAGLDDFRGQRKSRPSLTHKPLHSQAQRRLQRQRPVECTHAFGARVVHERVDELDPSQGLDNDLDRGLERYAGNDRFPLSPGGVR